MGARLSALPPSLTPAQGRGRVAAKQSTKGPGAVLVNLILSEGTGILLAYKDPPERGQDDGDRGDSEWEPVSASFSPHSTRQQLPHVAWSR